jgi:hypothetical protein
MRTITVTLLAAMLVFLSAAVAQPRPDKDSAIREIESLTRGRFIGEAPIPPSPGFPHGLVFWKFAQPAFHGLPLVVYVVEYASPVQVAAAAFAAYMEAETIWERLPGSH